MRTFFAASIALAALLSAACAPTRPSIRPPAPDELPCTRAVAAGPGDTLYMSVRVQPTPDTLLARTRERSSAVYAAGQPWYIENRPLYLQGMRYVRFGLPRFVESRAPTEARYTLIRAGSCAGVPFYVEPEELAREHIRFFHIRVTPSGVFQPFAEGSEVR